jgi:hypothetical protein
MIPHLQDDGNLPRGVHRCSFDGLVQRFSPEPRFVEYGPSHIVGCSNWFVSPADGILSSTVP